ncbi:MAG: hypothetical protein KFB97_05085 [Cyanobium sp. M30B3]|nr:MAG: hypothetical protein KFB97_05085 [Cyanobium sp. M30B3]
MRPTGSLVGIALLAGAVLAGHTSPVQAQWQGGIGRVAPGVICDRSAAICFDRQGPSIGLTRQYLGNAAAMRLTANLSGRPVASEFILSNGVFCSVAQSACWTSNRRDRLDERLTREFYPNSPALQGQSNVTKSVGLCSLTQRGRSIYDGTCELRLVSRDGGDVRRYSVTTNDGRKYLFKRSGSTFVLEDATGTWPVQFINHGYTGVFRWSDIKLVATRQHNLLNPQRPQPRNSNDVINDLFTGGRN